MQIHHSEINHGPKTVKITTRIRKYLHLNNNEDSIYQSLWDVTTTVFRKKNTVFNVCETEG